MRRRLHLLYVLGQCALRGQAFRQPGPNCSQAPCYNAENICGIYIEPCKNILRTPSGPGVGPGIWISVQIEMYTDGSYRRIERGSLDKSHCESGDPWLEIEYAGKWRESGPSLTTLGASLAHLKIGFVWLTLLKDKVCLPLTGYKGVPDPLENPICRFTGDALKALCPCNGWNWKVDGKAHKTNVGMFCSPQEQCPLLHDVFLDQTQYFSYNATASEACMYKASLVKDRGWLRPDEGFCYKKAQPFDCLAGALSGAPSRSASVVSWLLAVFAWQTFATSLLRES